jgi:hypothetical protein
MCLILFQTSNKCNFPKHNQYTANSKCSTKIKLTCMTIRLITQLNSIQKDRLYINYLLIWTLKTTTSSNPSSKTAPAPSPNPQSSTQSSPPTVTLTNATPSPTGSGIRINPPSPIFHSPIPRSSPI